MLPLPTLGIDCPACLKQGVAGRYEQGPTIPKAVLVCPDCGLMDLAENWLAMRRFNPFREKEVCHLCKESPHKTSCGMYSPYPKG